MTWIKIKENKMLVFFVGNILVLVFLGIIFQAVSEGVPQEPRLLGFIPFSYSYFYCGLFLLLVNALLYLITKNRGKK